MGKLIYLGMILMLGSCGANESVTALSTVNVDGREVSTIKIGTETKRRSDNLEVMTKDLGKMQWDDAVKACADLGDGWRLPTKDELNILYENKDNIGGFANSYYWSSTEGGNGNAWVQYFYSGIQYDYYKLSTGYVRAVRAF